MVEVKKARYGYTVTIRSSRSEFAKAFINGAMVIELGATEAAGLSKSLYSPKRAERSSEWVAAKAPAQAVNSFANVAADIDTPLPEKKPAKRRVKKVKDI